MPCGRSGSARLDEHLGIYTIEPLALRAGSFFSDAHAVFAVTHLATLARLLPERDPHENVFEACDAIVEHLTMRRPAPP